jgi:hypothetical protein
VSNQQLLLDVATVYPAQLGDTLCQIRQYCAASGVDLEQVSLIARSTDRALIEAKIGAVGSVIEIESFDDRGVDSTGAVVHAIRQRLSQLAAQGAPVVVEVVSYRGLVLKAIQSFRLPPLRILSINFQRLIGCPLPFGARAAFIPRTLGPWRFAHIATEPEAVSAMQKGLRERGVTSRDTAIRQASIRDVLALTDARFRGSSSTTGTHGMISHLVAVAQRQGLINVVQPTPRDAVNPVIWLSSETPRLESAVAVDPSPVGTGLAGSVAETPANSSVTDIPTDDVADQPSFPENEQPGTDSPSETIKKTLTAVAFGPYPIARAALYDSLDELFRGQRKATDDDHATCLRTLMREAITHAPAAVKRRGFDSLRQRGVWKHAAALVKKVLLRSGALASNEGSPILAGLGADLISIGEASKDWRCRADAEIVLAYVERAGQLAEASVEDLAGALYASRDDHPYQATVSAIRHLLDQKRLVKVGDTDEVYYELAAAGACAIAMLPEHRDSLAGSGDGNGEVLAAARPR